ncbi:MAG: ferrous iron transport protein A [Methylococcaceae bacterium]|nr:ferrous iron transport protein A [Methylococcaceae bacterium]
MRLSELKQGQKAILLSVDSETTDIIRLLEMGMVPGSEVTLLRRAPMGCPIEIAVCETELCLRNIDASLFHVKPFE